MKTLAFCILHTGRPYLRAAIESIFDQVDHIAILYCPTPSQGYQADIPCPDSRIDLLAEVFAIPGSSKKITWIDGKWANETEHVNAIWPYAIEGEFDWVWRFDADEISPPGMIREMAMQAAHERMAAIVALLDPPAVFRVPFVHFWRSFSRVCQDGSHPVRLFSLHGGDGEVTLDSKLGGWFVFHMGYAQPTAYITYKMQVSGHRPEWRADWFKDRWLANAQADVHPVMFPTHWMPEDFAKATMPEVLRKHEFYGMDVIE